MQTHNFVKKVVQKFVYIPFFIYICNTKEGDREMREQRERRESETTSKKDGKLRNQRKTKASEQLQKSESGDTSPRNRE